jgi:hypothetical protein
MKVIIIIINGSNDNEDGSYLFFALVILSKAAGVRNK